MYYHIVKMFFCFKTTKKHQKQTLFKEKTLLATSWFYPAVSFLTVINTLGVVGVDDVADDVILV